MVLYPLWGKHTETELVKTIQYLGSEKVVGGWEVSEILYAFLHVYYIQDNAISVLPLCNVFRTV